MTPFIVCRPLSSPPMSQPAMRTAVHGACRPWSAAFLQAAMVRTDRSSISSSRTTTMHSLPCSLRSLQMGPSPTPPQRVPTAQPTSPCVLMTMAGPSSAEWTPVRHRPSSSSYPRSTKLPWSPWHRRVSHAWRTPVPTRRPPLPPLRLAVPMRAPRPCSAIRSQTTTPASSASNPPSIPAARSPSHLPPMPLAAPPSPSWLRTAAAPPTVALTPALPRPSPSPSPA